MKKLLTTMLALSITLSPLSYAQEHPYFKQDLKQVAMERLENKSNFGIIIAKIKINSDKIQVAAAQKLTVSPQPAAIASTIDGEAKAIINNGRTMLPVRDTATALALEVEWDQATKTITLKDPDELKLIMTKENLTKIQIPIETNNIITKNQTIKTDIKPLIKDGRTYLSVANVAKALGLDSQKDILWNPDTKEIIVIRSMQLQNQ